jgi:hypothetical protein
MDISEIRKKTRELRTQLLLMRKEEKIHHTSIKQPSTFQHTSIKQPSTSQHTSIKQPSTSQHISLDDAIKMSFNIMSKHQ